MENSGSIETIITVIVVAIWAFIALRKKVKAITKASDAPPTPVRDDESDPYFTYETLENNYEISNPAIAETKSMQKEEIIPIVPIEEMEEANFPHLELSQEEIYKGIIYSEIFQRRYN